jgi:hypothetical protein
MNGFGTSYHGGAAAIRWEKPEGVNAPADHDAVECAIALGFPVFPYQAVHTFHWSHRECRVIVLRRTPALLLRAMLRPYLLATTWVSGVLLAGLALIAIVGPFVFGKPLRPQPELWTFVATTAGIFLAGLGPLLWLRMLFARSRDLRLVMGPHEAGSSDPATWLHSPPQDLVAECTLAAAEQALTNGQFSRAMFGARIAAALGDRHGEKLTDRILADRRVLRQLPALRRKPWLRKDLFPDDTSLRVPFENRRSVVSPFAVLTPTDASYHA